ncbi:MAG: Ig-like domain-containing protein, partial [Oscillospiraceae bacterium]|nr:Ig-like domain-containing protein [Oscillospiraceae bacterium]
MKHKLLRRLSALALALVLALSMAVTPAWAADITAIRITLNGEVVTGQISIGKGELIKLECIDQNGDAAEVTWSKDGNGVTINQTGGVRGQTPGSVTHITATAANGTTATCTVTVQEPATGIRLLPGSEFTMYVGDTQTLIAILEPAGAAANLTWTSSNPAVAKVEKVNGNGMVTAVGAGTATITVSAGSGISAECKFTVETQAVTSISLPPTLTVAVGATEELTPTLTPVGAAAKLTWTSSNEAAAIVDQNGRVMGLKAGAAVTITVRTDNGRTATCRVTVQAVTPATSVTLNQASLQLNPGSDNTVQLRATVTPTNSTDKVVWTSSNPNVASVDENGLVTALREGTATIIAMAGNKSAQCSVTVGPTPYGFTFMGATGSGEVQTLQLTDTKRGGSNAVRVTPAPWNAVFTYASVVWSVVNPETNAPDQSVVKVEKYSETQNSTGRYDASGRTALVTVVGPGKAKLVVTSGTAKGECIVEIPGITIEGSTMTIQNGKLALREGDVEQLAAKRWGSVANAGGNIIWTSSDSSIVIVDPYSGRLTARTPGTVKVTASLGSYEAEVTVTVQEDVSGLIQVGQQITAGSSVNLATASATVLDPETNRVKFSGTISSVLNSIAQYNTGSALSYISNLSVATNQGILHDNHRSEADTGAGVGGMDRYY